MQRLGFLLIISLIGCGGASTRPRPTARTAQGAQAKPADQDCIPDLKVAPEARFRKLQEARPDAENDSFAIAVGETLCLDAREAGGTLVDFHMVGAGAGESRPMKVQLTYRSDVGYMMMISNSRSRTMRYHAVLFVRTQDGATPKATSTLPVPPGLVSMENWPAPAGAIAGVALHHFELPESAP